MLCLLIKLFPVIKDTLNPNRKLNGQKCERMAKSRRVYYHFTADNTLVCGGRFDPVKHITMHVVPKKHAVFLKRFEEMFSRY